MTSREHLTQARHVMLLSNDAPVLNRCAREEAHLKQRLAQSTAACALLTQQSHAAAAREERSHESRLRAQLTALLSDAPDIVLPSVTTLSTTQDSTIAAEGGGKHAAAANGCSTPRLTIARSAAVIPSPGLKSSSATAAGESATPAASPPCMVGFPDAFESSGFKSTIHWASVAYDETFLTAYGPRQCRKEAQAKMLAGTGGSAAAREAQPHRLMTAVACYLLNEVLCADAAVSKLWQEKLRQPIFDAIFSSHTIAMGQERCRAQRGGGVGSATVADAIVHRTIGPTSSLLPGHAADCSGATSFPPRTNTYTTREGFALLRLWFEEVAVEQREKASVCHRVRSLQDAMARRQMAVRFFQRRAHQAELQALFTVWRAHTRQRRANRRAMECYLMKRHHRHVEETVFLRWRRFTLRSKVEALQRRVLNLAASRDSAAREHAAALRELQDQLSRKRRQHLEEAFERDTLHSQVLDSHAMEVDALQLMLKMEKLQTVESSKWAMRWERVAKTFRPAKPCPAVPRSIWAVARALLSTEEALAAVILQHKGDQLVPSQTPGSLMPQARQQMEQVLLMWVNSIMEASPQAATWVNVDAFTCGQRAEEHGILLSQKHPSSRKSAAQRSGKVAGAGNPRCEFNIYMLVCLVRELRRCYTRAGLMEKVEEWDTPDGANEGGPSTLADCFQELAQLIVAQTCGGLYPPLLAHCPSWPLWFTAEGVFFEPASNLEGPARRRRQQQQHTTFLWLLASLLVGHVQVMWMPPFGDRVAPPLQRPAEETETLQCKHEAEMMKLTQVSFIARHAAPPARLAAVARGTSVVAPNTLLPKKRSAARPAAPFPARAATRASSAATAVENTEGEAAAGWGMTLEAALRARCQEARGSTRSSGSSVLSGTDLRTAAGESLSDIEAFLGMEPTQVESLKGMSDTCSSEGEDDKDRLVDGLLHELFKAEDAEAQQRRTMRLQGGGCGRQTCDTAAAAGTARPVDGNLSKGATILTAEQLRLLRSLPGRSFGFDTLRPIATAPSKAAPEAGVPLTTHSSTASYASAASLYSFLVNTLNDTVARQQWHGLARIVTSLVVRFHVLDYEETTRLVAMLETARESHADWKSARVSHPSPMPGSGSPAAGLPPVPVGCTPAMTTKKNACEGAAGVDNPRSSGRIAARLVPTAPSQLSQPPPARWPTNKVQRHLDRARGFPRTTIASDSGATPSLEEVEHAVPVTSAQALATTVTSVMLGEELRRHGAHEEGSAQESFSNNSPAGYSGQTLTSLGPCPFSDPPNSTEASSMMVPLLSSEIHTPVIPTAAFLSADGDAYGVEQYAAEATNHSSGITPKYRRVSRSATTENARTIAATTKKAGKHDSAGVLARDQGAEDSRPQADAPAPPVRMHETAQQPFKGTQDAYSGTLVHDTAAFAEAHARASTRYSAQSPPPSARAEHTAAASATSTGSACLWATENVLAPLPNACSSSSAAPSSRPSDTPWTASGTYISPTNVTLQVPLPPTLPAPALPPSLPPPPAPLAAPPSPSPPSAPASNDLPDPTTVPQNPLSPLVLHAAPPPQSGAQKGRKDHFQMRP
ncbi:hypothetical protein LSCM1_00426 [Leishmania martiniquensis]|uniref:Uncharacterized protein n=1 Tax=Leishmania martiniquensis TaxID=1580590 RepID=A0A836GT59_9TRYP|nr:hypothetical protein LSCM1_00426 [Leishmania martiniquensis]